MPIDTAPPPRRARAAARAGASGPSPKFARRVSPALGAPGCVLLLDAVHDCAFVVRLCQMTPMARRYPDAISTTDHWPTSAGSRLGGDRAAPASRERAVAL